MTSALLTGELAKATGVSADTIRHYEKKGVIPPAARDASGYRRYPPETVERVLLVRRALRFGFTLDDLTRIFRQRHAGAPPCREVQSLATRKLRQLDEEITDLIAVRDALAKTLESWTDRLAATPDGEMANLLETLIEGRKNS